MTAARVSVRVSRCGYVLLWIVTGLCPVVKAALCPIVNAWLHTSVKTLSTCDFYWLIVKWKHQHAFVLSCLGHFAEKKKMPRYPVANVWLSPVVNPWLSFFNCQRMTLFCCQCMTCANCQHINLSNCHNFVLLSVCNFIIKKINKSLCNFVSLLKWLCLAWTHGFYIFN